MKKNIANDNDNEISQQKAVEDDEEGLFVRIADFSTKNLTASAPDISKEYSSSNRMEGKKYYPVSTHLTLEEATKEITYTIFFVFINLQ